MHWIDYGIIIAFLVVQAGFGMYKRIGGNVSAGQLILGGRLLTLPAFVASLVSTWYGGILGVGEYSYRFGLSNWLVLGLPYYVAAALFALLLARKARESELLTIPDRLAQAYGRGSAVAGGVIIFFMTVPAAYIIMLGTLGNLLFGWPVWWGVVAGTLFSTFYVYLGGFNSLVRTDIFQFIMMFLGFVVLFLFLALNYGGLDFLQQSLPENHLTWHGGRSGWYIATWYIVALSTLIDPAFFQRCYAAKSPSIARKGIFISIGCWALFDFLTTSCGLYARAILPDLDNPVASYPALALQILPVGLVGLVTVAMLVTVMSTVDSYSFLAASTFGNDIVDRLLPAKSQHIRFFTRIGLAVSTVIAVALALFFESVVDIWYAFGSIGTPALLVPMLSSFVGSRQMSSRTALFCILSSGALSLAWYLSPHFTSEGAYWLGVEPIFPGLAWSILLYVVFAKSTHAVLPSGTDLRILDPS